MIGTLAARAWWIASRVWGMTPSSAATTTITAMSVTRAPRARIAVNASWPGVSRNTIRRPSLVDLAGADVLGDPAALTGRHGRRPERVEQARLAVVDVAHDGHDRGPGLEQGGVVLLEQDLLGPASATGSSPAAARAGLFAATTSATSKPSSPATSDAVSRSISWLMVAKMSLLMSSRITSAALTSSSSASSLTVIVAGSSIAPRSRGSRTCTPPGLNAGIAARRLAGSAPAAGAAPTPCHAFSLMVSIDGWGRRRSAGDGVQDCVVDRASRGVRRATVAGMVARSACSRARLRGRGVPAGRVAAEVGAAPGRPTGGIDR